MEAMNHVSLPGAQGPQRPTQLSLAPPGLGHSGSSAATSPSPTPSTPADSGRARDVVLNAASLRFSFAVDDRVFVVGVQGSLFV